MEVFIRKTSPRGFLKKVCFSNLCKEKRREKQNVNMPRQSFDIRENEQFSIEIKKCPCLFDKSNAEYKEKIRSKMHGKKLIIHWKLKKVLPYVMIITNFYFMIVITDITDIFQFPKFTSG